MGRGLERITDGDEAAAVRRQAYRVIARSLVATSVVMIGVWLLP